MKKNFIYFFFLFSTQLLIAQANCDITAIHANESSNAVCFDTSGAVRYCISNNYPDHSDNYNQPQFTVEATDEAYSICAYPDTATAFTPLYEATETTVGCTFTYAFGVAINGVKFDPNSGDEFENSEGETNINWHVEALSDQTSTGRNMGTDNGGHLNPFGEYHYHGLPDDYFTSELGVDGSSHSPIVGYAADGFPIYYHYVYTTAIDSTSAIVSLTSGYSLKTGTRPGDGDSAPDGNYDGTYYEDYEYTSTDLDECNGRYGITPDFPYGTYYYVITSNYPHIPRCFKGTYIDHTFRIGPSASCPESTAATDCAAAIYGCMDPFATNYNANANVDDGSCQYDDCAEPSVGGTVSKDTTVCSGNHSVILTLSGETGSVVKWQSASTSDFASATDISHTSTAYTVTNISTSTYFRAAVQNGNNCDTVFSSSVLLTVESCSNGECSATTMTVNGTSEEGYITAGTYQAITSISSDGIVESGTTITFKAGSSITLEEGFHAESESEFSATIEDCETVLQTPSTMERSTTQTVQETPLATLEIAPNPLRNFTNLSFNLPQAETVRLQITNGFGQLVATPIDQVPYERGEHLYMLKTTDYLSGVYFVHFRFGSKWITKKILVLR